MTHSTPQAPAAAGCPFAGTVPSQAKAGSRSNRDWWPEQLNLSTLHQHSAKSDPMGADFDYAQAFKSLDLDAVVADLHALMTVIVWRTNSSSRHPDLTQLLRRKFV